MRRLLSFALAALTGLAAASSQAGEYGRRPVARPAVTALPPEMPYRDPHPRFRAPPLARFAVRAYVPRPTNQPMFNEPPQPLR
ncbi:hypothetical protein Mpop_5380 [Methylorubrum populi BJ001]|jgi:hypothetical protein|uniref:Uncharacterized protein n=1 Tax=Methylorubrum populi (strain ATCC BAA-705 / NCIMB 13946 / BJ001) TaxID=441620 RepID=B1ZBR4_METPB|nr:hypothetical protein [Methylorubrum populi]ACB83472.1 hypothetical protein Mpop_5380 [Methylorubrum populi BJ001]OAH39308.1 hypothetical protein AX289_14935 [Methylorubrum populi]PZP71687.1 MAG: hypothetical protein DI590_05325 [Methylorubrum populi]